MPRNLRDVIEFPAVNPAGAELSAPLTFRMIARAADGVPMLSVNGGAFAPLAGAPGVLDFAMAANSANAFLIHQALEDYLAIDTLNAAPAMRFGESGVRGLAYNFNLRDNIPAAHVLSQDGNDYQSLSTQNGVEAVTFGEAGAFALNFVFHVKDNAQPFAIVNAAGTQNLYLLDTSNGADRHSWDGEGPGASYALELAAGRATAYLAKEGARQYFGIVTTAAAEKVNIAATAPATCVIEFGGITPMLMGARALTITEIAADPGAAVNGLQLYAKDVAGVTRLFAQLSNGTVVALTP